jgi:preprotein translocase subunit SecY|uniref:preprotein translocase subunit SecY n=1 Tax=Candidatus Planktophila sp. TaxID=2175601 RepID=UPI00404ACC22
MLSAFGMAFKTPELRKKIFFTLSIMALFRFGSTVPTPGVSYTNVKACIDQAQTGGLFGLINLFSGGALISLSVFALGIMPYITASIIVQLLTVVIPRFEALKKEGQSGTAKLTQYTRYLTIGLAVLQSTGLVAVARTPGRLISGCSLPIVPDTSWQRIVTMIIVMTAGTSVVMWLGELITDRGVGNGMSILIFTSIAATFPSQLWSIRLQKGLFAFLFVCAVGILVIAAVVFVEQAQRRIPVQYAKRMVGRQAYGGTSTYIPIKVNQAGVIPVIFASSLLYIPSLLVNFTNSQSAWAIWISRNLVNGDNAIYMAAYSAMIIFFTYFYVAITFNPDEVADNMKKYGGFIPGIRAGRPTSEYLQYVLSRITAPGSIYLALVAIIPIFALILFGATQNFPFGGTAILIVVGVGLDTAKQIESQLQQRSYEGFLK